MTSVLSESNEENDASYYNNDIAEYQDLDYFESPESPEYNNDEEDNANDIKALSSGEAPYFPEEYQAKNYQATYSNDDDEDNNYSNRNPEYFDDSDMMEDSNAYFEPSLENRSA